MQRFSQWLIRRSGSKTALLVLVLFLLFTGLVLPAQNEKFSASGGDRSPDLSLFYSAADLLQMAEDYGPAGRAAYVQARIEFDILWPVVYGIFLCVGISWVLQRILPKNSPWRLLNLLPLLAVGFDFLENLCAAIAMHYYPQSPVWAVRLAPVFTPVKWLFVGGCFGILCVAFLVWVVKSIQKGMGAAKV